MNKYAKVLTLIFLSIGFMVGAQKSAGTSPLKIISSVPMDSLTYTRNVQVQVAFSKPMIALERIDRAKEFRLIQRFPTRPGTR